LRYFVRRVEVAASRLALIERPAKRNELPSAKMMRGGSAVTSRSALVARWLYPEDLLARATIVVSKSKYKCEAWGVTADVAL